MGQPTPMHGILYLSQTALTGFTTSGVYMVSIRSILSLSIRREATSAALVGLLSVSTTLNLTGTFFPYSLIKTPPNFSIAFSTLAFTHGVGAPRPAKGPVEGSV